MDKLQLYRGNDEHIGPFTFHCPTLNEIVDYGELSFFSLAYHLCSIPTDYMSELEDQGIKYEDVDEYEFFLVSLWGTISNDDVSIILPDFKPEDMVLAQREDQLVRWDESSNYVFDKSTYKELTTALRDLCGFKYAPKIAGNALTREKLIEIDRIKKKKSNKNTNESTLFPLISSMVNCADFKYNHRDVWDMPFFAFMDSVKRVQAVRTAHEMCTGGYFGVKLADVKQYTNWMRSL